MIKIRDRVTPSDNIQKGFKSGTGFKYLKVVDIIPSNTKGERRDSEPLTVPLTFTSLCVEVFESTHLTVNAPGPDLSRQDLSSVMKGRHVTTWSIT